jgi:hypothetical protein
MVLGAISSRLPNSGTFVLHKRLRGERERERGRERERERESLVYLLGGI